MNIFFYLIFELCVFYNIKRDSYLFYIRKFYITEIIFNYFKTLFQQDIQITFRNIN